MKTYNSLLYLFALVFTLSYISCSDDTSDDNQQIEYFSIFIESECGNVDTRFKYCIEEAVYQRIIDNIQVGDPCQNVSFKDINGQNQSGIFRSAARSSQVCEN